MKKSIILIALVAMIAAPVVADAGEWILRARVINVDPNESSDPVLSFGGEVAVECQPENGQVRFSVRDTGCGIPGEELDAIFESFYQVDGSTTRRHGGTGLGLTISRRLAELMGGSLGLESPGVDQGATASLCLQEYVPERRSDGEGTGQK